MTTINEHTAAFDVERALAIKNSTCGCLCGCRVAGVAPLDFIGIMRPDLCADCARSARSITGRKAHHVPRSVAEVIDREDEASETVVEPLRRVLRAILPDRLAEATAYAREYGEEGSRFMAEMHRKVIAGRELTAAQTDAVMACKRADSRSVRAAYKRAVAESVRVGKEQDLLRIRIPDSLPADKYAVTGDRGDIVILEVARPKGKLRGFTVVECLVGVGTARYGVQYPQPYRDADRFPQTYRGYLPHLVKQLVDNPAKARERYQTLLGKPV